MPFLLRCWLISSIGEDPALARSRWLKKKSRLHGIYRRGSTYSLSIGIFMQVGLRTKLYFFSYSKFLYQKGRILWE